MLNIIVSETKDFSEQAVAELQQFAHVELSDLHANELIGALKSYDVFWFRLGFKLTSDIISQAERCKYIICPVTGLDHIDLKACEAKGIHVISLRGEYEFLKKVRATAELTMGLTLALLRDIPKAVHSTQVGDWTREPFKGIEVFEKKVGILGFGRLGQITASYFSAMGAQVFIYDINQVVSDKYIAVNNMDELFEQCDIVSVHVNLNTQNHHLIGSSQFKQMKSGGYFINTSRGQLVKSEDLVDALEKGYLKGAAIDVIENEYNHKEDILLQYSATHQNLIITPHIGGNTYESFAKTEMYMVEKLKQQLKNTK